MKAYSIIAAIAIVSFCLICQHSYAETQTPGVMQATKGYPYYFSEEDFGLGILQSYQQVYQHWDQTRTLTLMLML